MAAPQILTPQRRAALQLLGEYHYLTTRDFYHLLGASDADSTRGRAVRRLLTLLYRAGLVYRTKHILARSDDPFLRYEHCYRLSRNGLAVVGTGRSTPEKSPVSLDHELEISRFHLALAGAVRPSTYRLRWWQTNLKRTVNPDALFALTDGAKPRESSTHYYFLEVEKSRQGHYRNRESGLIAKLRRYAEYRRTERCRTEWQYFADFRVVVVLKNCERQLNLLRELHVRLPQRFIWTVTEADYRERIAGAVFRAPPDFEEAAYSLISE